jgi:membrane protein implicated in regulation of membrane protease activity
LFQIDTSWFRIDPWLIAVIAICVVAFLAVAIIWGIRAHRHRVSAGREDLIGKTAEVKVVLKPKGVVFVEGERWTAELDKGQAKPGEEVLISRVEGLKLWVTKKQ